MSEQPMILLDTTLQHTDRTTQSPLTLEKKIQVAQSLEKMGIQLIEVGRAGQSEELAAQIRAVSQQLETAAVCSLAHLTISDVTAAAQSLELAKKARIHLSVSTSNQYLETQAGMSHLQLLDRIYETVSQAVSLCEDVQWSALDATTSDPEFLFSAIGTAIDAGAGTIGISDTEGHALPDECRHLIEGLHAKFPDTIFSLRCCDRLGLALANVLASFFAGARQIEGAMRDICELGDQQLSLEQVLGVVKNRSDVFG